MARLDEYLRLALKEQASDLHLSPNVPVHLRVDGQLLALHEPAHTVEEVRRWVNEILSEEEQRKLMQNQNLTKSYTLFGEGFFRAQIFYGREGLSVVFRVLPDPIPKLESLGGGNLGNLLGGRRGLMLIIGPTGSGKSTTMASMIDYLNRNQKLHILTLEHPLEFLHDNKSSIVTQLEVGTHCPSIFEGVEGAMREDADVIGIGEISSAESMAAALAAAEAGHWVIACLRAVSVQAAMDWIASCFPSDQAASLRSRLADCLVGVVNTRLVRNASRAGRTLSLEIFENPPGEHSPVRTGNLQQWSGSVAGLQPAKTEKNIWQENKEARGEQPMAVHFPPVPASPPLSPSFSEREEDEIQNEIEALERMIAAMGDGADKANTSSIPTDDLSFQPVPPPDPQRRVSPTMPPPLPQKDKTPLSSWEQEADALFVEEKGEGSKKSEEAFEMTNTREVKVTPPGLVPPPPLPQNTPWKKKVVLPAETISPHADDEDDEATVAATGIQKRSEGPIFKPRSDKGK